jgi:hypothetical protein
LVFLIWPEPYEFRVSQSTFQAVEKKDGEYVPLDDFQIGYEKLAAFERRCQVVAVLSGMIGAYVAHLTATLLTGRDVSVLIMVAAIPLIMIGMWIATANVPETVDPVYGDGFAISLPFWFYMLVIVFWAIAAAIIEACVLTIRWIMGKYVLKAS